MCVRACASICPFPILTTAVVLHTSISRRSFFVVQKKTKGDATLFFSTRPRTIMDGDDAAFAHANDGDHDATDAWNERRLDNLEGHASASTSDDVTAESGDDADDYDVRDNNYYGLLCSLEMDDNDDIGSDAIVDAVYGDGPHALTREGLVANDADATHGDWPCTDGDDDMWPLQSYATPDDDNGSAPVVWPAATDTLPSDIGDLLPVYQDLEDLAPDAANALGHYDPAFDLFYANALAGISASEALPDGADDGTSVVICAAGADTPTDAMPAPDNESAPGDLCDAKQCAASVHPDDPTYIAPMHEATHETSRNMGTEGTPLNRARESEIEPSARTMDDAKLPAHDATQRLVVADDDADDSCGSSTDDGTLSACDSSASQPFVAVDAVADDAAHGDDAIPVPVDCDLVGNGDDVDDADRLMIASFDSINIAVQSALSRPDASVVEEKVGSNGDASTDASLCNGGVGGAGTETPPAGESPTIDPNAASAAPPASAPEPVPAAATAPSTDSASSKSWWSPWSWWSGKAAPAGTASAASDARLKAPGLVLTKADLDSVKLRPVSERGPRPPVAATPDGVLGQLLGLFGGIAAVSAPPGGSSDGVDSTRPPSVRALVAAMEGASVPLA